MIFSWAHKPIKGINQVKVRNLFNDGFSRGKESSLWLFCLETNVYRKKNLKWRDTNRKQRRGSMASCAMRNSTVNQSKMEKEEDKLMVPINDQWLPKIVASCWLFILVTINQR